jgi:hypothetical protein
MGDVTGPICTLPGASHALPAGTMCDDHPDRPAVARIQGETDSFGSELWDLCEECRDKMQEAKRQPITGRCDWCTSDANDLRPHRDYEEGSSGRVYDVCAGCRKREAERLQAELDDGDWDGWGDNDG